MNVLLVEDSATDALLAQRSLSEDLSFRITAVVRLADAIAKLKETAYDVVLLDLGLPDSQGLDTLHSVLAQCGADTAVVVLTINDDRTQGALALRAGAQDYLFKNHVSNSEALRRCIVYAFDRRRHLTRVNALERELDQARKQERHHEETAFWSELTHSNRMELASHARHEQASLPGSTPETRERFARDYGEILERSVEQRVRKTSDDISALSARLARHLGERNATPREVIDFHLTALRQKMDTALSLVRAEAYQEEGRLRLVELMGFLAAHYRARALASLKSTAPGQ